MKNNIARSFEKIFQSKPILAFAPARINLIGEHTDYQEGLVFPAAIEQGIWVAIQENDSSSCRIYSEDYKEEFVFDIHSFSPKKGHWANYIMGVVSQFQQAGYKIEGFDLVFGGNIPASGLSSSAALSVAIGTALTELFKLTITKKSIVLYAQKAEHLFAGVKCGIMDPYASAFGVKNRALLLDCRTNTHFEVEVDLGKHSLLLVNSKVKHSLADSAYNKRREACEESVQILKATYPEATTLRDIPINDLEKVKALLPETLFPKAKHVITEIERVNLASNALHASDLNAFGNLLKESHRSLSEDFEVSCEELDFLAEQSWELPGVLGSRMMGGGFGGCTINLISNAHINDFQSALKAAYRAKFNIEAEFIQITLSEGARIIEQ
ncbi:galactokinase [Algoriphagus ratkowskyi]|uniref:Galactokinase n=1 Tax=Algoriphagus ratkowskyi TaxID=57028 RepID=A0A2W7RH38_9BACT|nr:galactokinase [Algoriphagus ratkowskyi]PZX57680.1 galactokinase [Algoriphagus ratkowskyi]TXD78951.1 galactokinase [Algoriphagus ratkowskyi]